VSIRIVTDSTADLPAEVASQHQIEVVPLGVLFGDEELRDGIDISAETFFTRLQNESQLPTTSQPSAGAFREVYERLAADGATEILSIHVSGKLSGTLEAARQGASGLDVHVIHVDSQIASLALGIGVVAVSQAVERGATLDEARDLAEDQFRRTHCFFVLDTLEYLRRGGRIGNARAALGTLLKVKPILAFRDGEVVDAGRARTRAKAFEEALRLAAEFRPIEQMMVVDTTTPNDVEYVADRLRNIAPEATMVTGMIGPTVGVHAGPGAVGFAVVSAPAPDSSPPADG